MISLHGKAYAKLNLTLEVLNKRQDGYHNLRSIMQTVSLCDDIVIELDTGKPWEILVGADARSDVPQDERNLAWKAARLFFDRMGIDPNGITMRMEKRIPSQAGMAGGSADAAAVLRLLNKRYGTPLSVEELCALGAAIGSDVPFCVLGGTALCEGRGEILTPLQRTGDLFFAICKPEAAFSTPELFRKLDEVGVCTHPSADYEKLYTALKVGDSRAVGENLCNDFERAVESTYPELAQIKAAMLACGAIGAQMTGSGSAIFGLFATGNGAKTACEQLKALCAKTYFATAI